VSLTPEQASAAHCETSVAVVAGAGTGKTHMLASRYLHHLKQGLSPLEVVAVTFTEKAAAELRARIRAYAHEELPERPEALVELEAAQISTIHALASRICRDHPDAADVPPDFGVLEALEGELWMAERFEEALATLPASIFEALPYALLKDALVALLEEPAMAEEALQHGPDGWAALVERARGEALSVLTTNPDWQEAVSTVRRYEGAADDLAEIARRHALHALHLLGTDTPLAFEVFAEIKLTGGKQGNWPPGSLPGVKAALKTLREAAAAAAKEGLVLLALGPADERLAASLPALREAFTLVRSRLRDAKRRARVLDFSDLEAHALKALSHEEVRGHYALRWRAVLVDEFQDTNPVQARLLELLTSGMRLTIVGDEKQSIYGFRGADVSVFQEVRSRILREGGGEVILRESFRAHTELVNTFNLTFRPVLAALHQDLDAKRTDTIHGGPFITLHTVEAERGVNKGQRQVTEARCIGTLIKDLLERDALVPDKRTGEPRPLRLDDIAVLTRTWAPLSVYGEVLPALGVPAVHTGGGNLLETREAKDGVALLRFLADPRDNLALAAVLRSPFFAVDDRSLYHLALALEDEEIPSWWDAVREGSAEALERPKGVLGELFTKRRELLPSRLLQLADYLTGYSAVLANLPGAARREADWRGFLELTRSLEGGLQDVFTVSRRLRRLMNAGANVPRPTLQAEGAVTLMTVHRSKGLEWPVVIVSDLDRGGGGDTPKLFLDRGVGVAMKLQDADGNQVAPALYTLLKHQAEGREEAEAKRVCYVALTRARDCVMLTATREKGGALDLLAPGLEAAGVPHRGVPHDPLLAVYPDPPLPRVRGNLLEGLNLWEQDPAALGRYAEHVPPKRSQAPTNREGDSGSGAWAEALELVELTDDTWLPLVEALMALGAPPPDLDSIGRELTRGGTVTAYTAVMMWRVDDELALVDAATPQGTYDQELYRADPAGDPLETAGALCVVLGRFACAS
jgi:ATP-dependent helicase/nuclease subunit A